MNRYNDNYNRYNDDRDSYRSRRAYNNYDDRNMDEGMRTYSDSSASNYGGVYNTNAWPDRDRYGYNDRNMFERMGDRIRDSWNDWRGERDDDRYYRENRNTYRDDRGYRDNRGYDDRRNRHHENIFERAGERVREFFRPPAEEDFSHERRRSVQDMNADYSRTGFGNYEGTYGAYTGVHGTTGFNTGTRDNYTTDYNRHYRPSYDNDMYRENPINTRYGQREGRYVYHPGDYGAVDVGEFHARERYDNYYRPRYANYKRY